MKLNSSIKNKTIATIILVVMGLGFLVAAIFLHINDYNIKNNWIEETATIIEINHFKENIKMFFKDFLMPRNLVADSSFTVFDVSICSLILVCITSNFAPT